MHPVWSSFKMFGLFAIPAFIRFVFVVHYRVRRRKTQINYVMFASINPYLTAVARIRCEDVLPGFREISVRFDGLEFDAPAVLAPFSIGDPRRRDATLEICGRLGARLRSLTLSDRLGLVFTPDCGDLATIAACCPLVETIVFNSATSSLPADITFAPFVRLVSLVFTLQHHHRKVAPLSFFLRGIPGSIERLIGVEPGVTFRTLDEVETFFRTHPRLRELRTSNFHCGESFWNPPVPVFRLVAAHCPQLKRIEMTFSNCDGIELLADIVELRFIVCKTPPTDEQMITFCNANRATLEVLDLGSSDPFKLLSAGGGFAAIAQLQRLRELNAHSGNYRTCAYAISHTAVNCFVVALVANARASLALLDVQSALLTHATIGIIGAECAALRYLSFRVRRADQTTAMVNAILEMVDRIVAANPPGSAHTIGTGGDRLRIVIVTRHGGFPALQKAAPVLPDGVELKLELAFATDDE